MYADVPVFARLFQVQEGLVGVTCVIPLPNLLQWISHGLYILCMSFAQYFCILCQLSGIKNSAEQAQFVLSSSQM